MFCALKLEGDGLGPNIELIKDLASKSKPSGRSTYQKTRGGKWGAAGSLVEIIGDLMICVPVVPVGGCVMRFGGRKELS